MASHEEKVCYKRPYLQLKGTKLAELFSSQFREINSSNLNRLRIPTDMGLNSCYEQVQSKNHNIEQILEVVKDRFELVDTRFQVQHPNHTALLPPELYSDPTRVE